MKPNSKKLQKKAPVKKSASPVAGRKTQPPQVNFESNILNIYKSYNLLKPAWFLKVIPIIRKLCQANPDFGQTLNNIVTLANTGHKVYFNPEVGEEQVNKMREHLDNKVKEWTPFLPGIGGFCTRLFSQAAISGALSCEWVINPNLNGIEIPILINPEQIRFKLNERGTSYEAYQEVVSQKNPDYEKKLYKLNPITYKYYALNGDGDTPYGCPPFLKALRSIATQNKLLDGIDSAIDNLGVMGFISILINKPDLLDNENEDDNLIAQEAALDLASERIKEGVKNGAIVGFKDEHKIDFHSTTKDFRGIKDLHENNELMVASGLNMDSSLLGRGYGSTESQITIVFTKLLSELIKGQNDIGAMLEYGYNLELRLAGFEYKTLKVKFRRSTITDELKYQQAREYQIKNLHNLRVDGIISQDDYADDLDYLRPYKQEPVVSFEDQDGKGIAIKDDGLNKKNASERKSAAKKKPQDTTKKTNNK